MAKDKKSFIAYCDWIESFEELSDEEAGRLAKHLFRYVNDKNPEAPDKLTKMCFIPIKQALKRDLNKYETIRERNIENGKKGGRPKKPTGLSGLNKKPKKAVNDNVSVNVNDIKEKPPTPKGEFPFKYDVYLEEINKMFGRNHKVVSDKLKRSIQARLREGYKNVNFLNAMINVKNNKFHKETNYIHVDPYFFAQESKLSKYGDKVRTKNTPNQIGATTEYYLKD